MKVREGRSSALSSGNSGDPACPCPAMMAPHDTNPAFIGTRGGGNDMKSATTVTLHLRERRQHHVVGGGTRQKEGIN